MSELAKIKFSHPAAIVSRAAAAAAAVRALSDEELKKLAVERAPDPAAFDEYPPIFIRVEATNNRLDAYYTRMAKSSLTNYAMEAAAGVSFQDSHLTDGLAFMLGRSLTGEFVGAQGNGVSRVLADLYTVQNLPETNNFVSKYRTGIASDVSIGFYGGRFECSICGLDMMSWDCWHYPGREYEVEEENGDGSKTVRKVVATAAVEDAHLAEISSVYKGATPGAVIVKALRDVEEGRLKPDVARFLEQRYRHLDLNLSRRRQAFTGHSQEQAMSQRNEESTTSAAAGAAAGAGATTTENADTTAGGTAVNADASASTAGTATDATTATATDAGTTGATGSATAGTDAAASAGTAAAGTADDARLLTQLRTLLSQRGLDAALLPPNARVFDLALDGLVYRNDLITAALKEGVRAHGAGFKRELYEKTLRAADVETIKLMRDDWARQAKVNFPSGRATEDEGEAPPAQTTPVDVPGEAFM